MFLILWVIFSCYPLLAGDLNFRKYAGEFMEIGVAPRAQGMGGAFVAVANDISASYYNPAALVNLTQTQISFMHTQQMIASVNYDYLAFGKPLGGNRVVGLSLIRLGIDNIKDSRQALIYLESDPDNWRLDWSRITEFNAADYIFNLSVAQRMASNWAFGGNVKLIRRKIADHSANGIGLDLSIYRDFSSGLTLGAALKNVTTTFISWDTGEKELVAPALFSGVSYLWQFSSFHLGVRPAVELILRGEHRQKSASLSAGALSLDMAAGLEINYFELLYFRSGYDEIQRFNLGVGIQIPHVRIDYAFTNYDQELGNSHRIGLIVLL